MSKFTKKEEAVLAAVAVALVVIPLGLAGGCGTTTRPGRITRKQRALIKATRLKLTVGVEKGVMVQGKKYEWTAYSDGLLAELRRTGLFRRVDRLEAFDSPPDLVARVEEAIPGSAAIPFATGITLGLFPTRVQERWGYPFSLRRPGDDKAGPRVNIRYVYTGHSTLGWLAVFLNALPNHTWHGLQDDPRFIDHFALEIVRNRKEIEALAGKPSPGGN
ncbi:MAG TPA: hypothetical protein VKA53_06390 [Thermoanaerobaculia bacterium]|nr:hypothetical protein [Thermoanaerobaculia bacterium]